MERSVCIKRVHHKLNIFPTFKNILGKRENSVAKMYVAWEVKLFETTNKRKVVRTSSIIKGYDENIT